jgi:hypothetical protein
MYIYIHAHVLDADEHRLEHLTDVCVYVCVCMCMHIYTHILDLEQQPLSTLVKNTKCYER